jgi:hypothetical protein
MRALRLALAAAAVLALALPHAAEAKRRSPRQAARSSPTSLSFGLGADWLLDPETGAFQLTFAADRWIARNTSFGARFGALFLSDPGRVGVPIDARLRFRVSRLYVEGLVGPWIVFDSDDAFRFHAGVGFGLASRSFQVGLEIGYLDPTATVGLRLAFPF